MTNCGLNNTKIFKIINGQLVTKIKSSKALKSVVVFRNHQKAAEKIAMLTSIWQVLVRILSTRVSGKSFEVLRQSLGDTAPELARLPDPFPANLRVTAEAKDEEIE
jgi:hypothetical protein